MKQGIAGRDRVASLAGPAWLGLAILFLASCRPAGEELVTTRLFVMATVVDITITSEALEREPALIAAIETELRAFERDFYAWSDGELAGLNRALSASESFEASSELAGLLIRSQQIALSSGGAFDPGVGALVELWGFHTSEPPDQPPADASIANTLSRSGSIADLVFDGSSISARASDYTLDLGGIAKGAAIDRVVERLEALAVSPALVNAGGDLRVIGQPTGRNWRIGIQAPRAEGILGTIDLFGSEAAFTSGDYERFFDVEDDRLHHILDPRTGRPAAHTQAVTVLAADGALADAAATALFVAGPAEWRQMAEALGIEAVLRVDATGEIEMTSGMRDRFRESTEISSDIIAAAD